ncbi:hypothetical protein QN277_019436 [Acacia crassicarpa]|uniref:DUF659 domain-containing protein n=1 Tax=Acacia crassicarpa TaxID=499986 RepID=A0AAE1JHI0_9FABA|nr:hypothetical protein QN277_019436 [Acacia crassicarpa]
MASSDGSCPTPSPGAGAGSSKSNTSNIGAEVEAFMRRKILPRNAPGNRSDIGWKHGTPSETNPRKIVCNYCKSGISGVYRFKHHLAGTQKDCAPCVAVSDEVRKEMLLLVYSLQEKLVKKSRFSLEEEESIASEVEKRKGIEVDNNPKNIFKKGRIANQTTINAIFNKNVREEACLDICTFLYNNAIPFNVLKGEEFPKMCESIARHGPGFKPPSYHEARVKYLKIKYDKTMELIEEYKAEWKKVGCTIMTDGWTDRRRRSIINFCVNSPMGTVFLKSIDASHITKTAEKIFKMLDEVVEEVGEENVVQVVTDNAANYKAAGEMLMEKRKKLY